MMTLRTLVVDDEVHARNILTHYIDQLPFMTLAGQYSNCLDCFEENDLDEIDLILLDINLPQVSGLQFSRTIRSYKTEVIFTTAYSDYALESYALSAVDYLLKPIEFERFKQAAERARGLVEMKTLKDKNESQNINEATQRALNKGILFVKSDYKIHRIRLDQICFIEGYQEYVKIHFEDQRSILTLLSLKRLADVLPKDRFIRIHKSYIINVDYIENLHLKNIWVAGSELKIGKNYEEELNRYIHDHALFR